MQGVIDAIKAIELGELFEGLGGLFQKKSFLQELEEVFASIGDVLGLIKGLF